MLKLLRESVSKVLWRIGFYLPAQITKNPESSYLLMWMRDFTEIDTYTLSIHLGLIQVEWPPHSRIYLLKTEVNIFTTDSRCRTYRHTLRIC